MINVTFITLLAKRIGLGSAAALLLWANWQAPNLHDYPAPVRVGALRVAGLRAGAQAATLRARLLRLPGITACTVLPDAQAVAYTYHPDEVTPTQVQQQLGAAFRGQAYHAPAAPVAKPQCLVPLGYVVALEQLRFALSLRRFFVKV